MFRPKDGDIWIISLSNHGLSPHMPSGKHRKNYGKSPFYSWVNQVFQLGHFQVRKLLVYQRVND